MVAPCGLEPQTSTVSICRADLERMTWSEYKLHGENRLTQYFQLSRCKPLAPVGGICTGMAGLRYKVRHKTKPRLEFDLRKPGWNSLNVGVEALTARSQRP
jgi:hypothetical protein